MVKQVTCQYPGCSTGGSDKDGAHIPGPYLTDSDCSSVKERSEDLDRHIKMVHELVQKQSEVEIKKQEAETAR